MKKIFYFAAVLVMGTFTACHHKNSDDVLDGPTKEGTTLDLVRDSIYLYTKEAYYWADGIPSYRDLQPRSINGSTDLAAVGAEVNILSQFKINPDTGQPYEYVANSGGQAKYSFIDNGQTSTALGGSKADFGFALTAISNTDIRVRYVYGGSSAGNNGLHRGDMLTTVNGRSNLDLSLSTDYNFVVNAIGTSPLSMTLKRPDNSTYSVTLTTGAYTVNPVLLYKTIDLGSGKKVGYIVFNSFTAPANATPKLDEAFASFTANGITDLVVDLRYNGGGYVSTSEYLANLIVPAAKGSGLMYNYYFNSTLQSGKAEVLKNQLVRDPQTGGLYNLAQVDYTVAGNAVNFSKKGSLNIARVFFLVTGSTASASELAINNLIPVMDVRLIGTTTYGKPVGFFALNINAYQLYVPEFETKNSAGQGGYYTGMNPNVHYSGFSTPDDLTKDFGDITEGLLSHALNYVKTGAYGVDLKVQSVDGQPALNRNLSSDGFSGMIADRGLKLKK